MRIDIKKLMEKLAVDRVLSPYETQPWYVYDAAKATTCSAEVRVGPGAEDIEAEIQLLKDSEEEGGKEGEGSGLPQQIMRMRFVPSKENIWSPTELKVKGEDFVNKVGDWEEKACSFFRACIQAMQMGDMPDIEELLKQELGDDDDWGGGKRGKIGRKSPKIKPGQLLGMKRGF